MDLASNPARKNALNKALATGKMAASSRVRLVQDRPEQNAVLVFLPQSSTSASGDKEENGHLLLGVFRIADMVTLLFGDGYHLDLVIELYDMDDTWNPAPLLTLKPDFAGDSYISSGMNEELHRKGTVSEELMVGDRTWLLKISPSRSLIQHPERTLPVIAFILCLLLSLLGCFIIWHLLNMARNRRNNELTAQLKAIFDNTYDGLFILEGSGLIQASNPAFQVFVVYAEHELPGVPSGSVYLFASENQRFY